MRQQFLVDAKQKFVLIYIHQEDNVKFFGRLSTLAALLLALSSCQSTLKTVNCQEADWYELGRRQGVQGVPLEKAEKLRPVCENSDMEANTALYRNGHFAGLVEYCAPENAFELGRTGQAYKSVCPKEMQSAFKDRYVEGKRYFTLQKKNRKIDDRMDDLFSRLNSSNLDPVTRSSVRSQLSKLRKERVQNQKQLEKLEEKKAVN